MIKTTTKSTQQQIVGLIGWFIACFAASAVGAIASIKAQSFYLALSQPSWAPPAWLFGPVWTALYAMMAVAVWLVWRRGGCKTNATALTLFALQLLLNALWSWLFFAWQLGAYAFADIILLWLLIVATSVAFWRTDKLASLLLLPYLLWVSFAGALNYAVWQLNLQILG